MDLTTKLVIGAAAALGSLVVITAWTEGKHPARGKPLTRTDPELAVSGPNSAARVMNHSAVLEQHASSLGRRRRNPVAVLVPCAKGKPFRESASHRFTYCPALSGQSVDVWVVSEPMGVIPYADTDRWPNDAYDFPPQLLAGPPRRQLVDRIGEWLALRGRGYERLVLALPRHHMALVREGSRGIDGLVFENAGVSACKERGACPADYDQVTTGPYRDFLSSVVAGAS